MSSRLRKLWKDDDMPRALLEAWAQHEAFRRLGFSPDDIFFGANQPAQMGLTPILKHQPALRICVTEDQYWQIVCVLKTQEKQFVVTCGWCPKRMSHEQILARWESFVERFNAGQIEDSYLQRVWERSQVRRDAVHLIEALGRAEIRIPGDLS